MAKNHLQMQETRETQDRSLRWEEEGCEEEEDGKMEEGKATHSSILAWRIPWTEKPSGLPSIGSQRQHTTEAIWCARTYRMLPSLDLNGLD